MTIYLIRHAETNDSLLKKDKNNILVNIDKKNVSLNDNGIIQCSEIKKKISSLQFECIITSDTKRTIQTATLINNNKEIIIDNRVLNKQENNNMYYNNLVEIIKNYKNKNVIIVTHGRIIKMLLSISKFNYINQSFLDSLNLYNGIIITLPITSVFT